MSRWVQEGSSKGGDESSRSDSASDPWYVSDVLGTCSLAELCSTLSVARAERFARRRADLATDVVADDATGDSESSNVPWLAVASPMFGVAWSAPVVGDPSSIFDDGPSTTDRLGSPSSSGFDDEPGLPVRIYRLTGAKSNSKSISPSSPHR
eukprot:2274147-Heterocapsa_arctica.AAC.1